MSIFEDDEIDVENSQTTSPETSEDSEISYFIIKAYNPLNEELALDAVDSYHGDLIYVKVIDESGNELSLDLFDFSRSNGIFTYTGYPIGQFLTSRVGKQTITAILKEDSSKQASISFNCVEGNTEIRFTFISSDELWYVTTQVKNNEYYLNYPDAYNSDLVEKNPKTDNVRQCIRIKSYYGKYTSPYLTQASGWPSTSEYDLTTSNSKVVKVCIDTIAYGSWMIEVTGNGTAEITATLLSDPSIKTSITITVENYPEKEADKTKTNQNNSSQTNEQENKRSQSYSSETNKQENKTNLINESSNSKDTQNNEECVPVLIDGPLYEYKEKIINPWCVITLLSITLIVLILSLVTKNKIFIIADATCAVFTLLLIVLMFAINKPINYYNKALDLFMKDGYKEALILLKDSNEELKKECEYQLVVDEILNGNTKEIPALIDSNMQILIDNYNSSSNLFDSYLSLYSLIDELSKHTSYKYESLYFLLNSKFKDYVSNEISTKEVGDAFMLKDYSFKIIEKLDNTIFVIADNCFMQSLIMNDLWKEEILNHFTDIESNIITKYDLILFTRDDFKEYCSKISLSQHSWWLDDISRVTKIDSNGVVHKLHYYAIGNDTANERNTSMIDDT